MFVEQWQHTWLSRDSPLVLITAANSGEAPLLLFRIWNSYFTQTFENKSSVQLRSKCYKPNTKVSASKASIMLYFIAIKDWLGVLELLGAKRECAIGYLDRHFAWIPSLRLAKGLHIILNKVIKTSSKILAYSQAFNFRPPFFCCYTTSANAIT